MSLTVRSCLGKYRFQLRSSRLHAYAINLGDRIQCSAVSYAAGYARFGFCQPKSATDSRAEFVVALALVVAICWLDCLQHFCIQGPS